MKRLIAIVLTLVCILGLVSCGKQDSTLVELPDNIEKITIAWNGGPLTTFSYTDSEKIGEIVEYISSLELISTKENPAEYDGGMWLITIYTNSEMLEMVHSGNMFFKTSDNKWWEIPYKQANELEAILKENLPDELPQNIIYDEWNIE